MSADSLIDMVINQKASFDVQFQIVDNGAPLNLAGFSVAAKYKSDFNTTDDQAVPFSASIANTTNGIIGISLTPEQTILLTEPRYVYDITITRNSTGIKTRIHEGFIKVSRGVT
jgi:hypothetical protein